VGTTELWLGWVIAGCDEVMSHKDAWPESNQKGKRGQALARVCRREPMRHVMTPLLPGREPYRGACFIYYTCSMVGLRLKGCDLPNEFNLWTVIRHYLQQSRPRERLVSHASVFAPGSGRKKKHVNAMPYRSKHDMP
jgi:hypothetical protein